MALNFPGSPSDGQTYVAPNGTTYVYDATNTLWRVQGGDGENVVFVSATAPVAPTQGKMWWNSDTGAMYIYYIDADGGQWVPAAATGPAIVAPDQDLQVASLTSSGDVQAASLNSGPLAGMRNQLINGDFRVWQRGNDITNPANQSYVADHWCTSNNPTRVQINGDVPTGQGLSYSCKLHPNGVPASGTRQALIQPIELVEQGRAGQFDVGTTWTLSYWMRGDAAGSILSQAEFRDSPNMGTGSINLLTATTNYTTTWARYSHTFTIGSGVVPSATHACLAVIFFKNVAEAHSIFITGVQLEPGPVATPFEHRPIGTELALCQRYYEKGEFWIQTPGSTVGSRVYYATTKRATPTVAVASMNYGTVPAVDMGTTSEGFGFYGTPDGASRLRGQYTADAEL
ncbi:tail fiber protein [Synechococcus phage MA10]